MKWTQDLTYWGSAIQMGKQQKLNCLAAKAAHYTVSYWQGIVGGGSVSPGGWNWVKVGDT